MIRSPPAGARFRAGIWGRERPREGADVDGGEVEQTHSHLHSVGVEITEGSGPAEGKDIDGGAVERAHPSPSTTPVPHDGKPDGA